MSTRHLTALATTLAATLLLTGCDTPQQIDPYRREGVWRPEGVVAANLAAQVANPEDLRRGRGETGPSYKTATPVSRLWGPPISTTSSTGAAAPGQPGGQAGAAADMLRSLQGLPGQGGGAPR